MTRLNTNAELWAALSQFGYSIDSTAASTGVTITTATTAGAEILALSSSGQSTGDYMRIGDDSNYEMVQAQTPSTSGFTAFSAFSFAHSTGETALLVTRVNVGDVSDDGVSDEISADRTQINAATQRHAYDHHINHTNYRVTVNLENLSLENWAFTAGIAETGIHGAGTTADPYVVDFTPDNLDGHDPLFMYARGTLKNGNTVEIQWWDCRIDPTKTVTYARGQDAPLQLVFDAAHRRILYPVA